MRSLCVGDDNLFTYLSLLNVFSFWRMIFFNYVPTGFLVYFILFFVCYCVEVLQSTRNEHLK